MKGLYAVSTNIVYGIAVFNFLLIEKLNRDDYFAYKAVRQSK